MAAKLKVYLVGNIDGTNSALVAAPTKREAARLPGFRSSWPVEYPGRNRLGDGYDLALATPGIVWTRNILARPEADWACRDPLAGAMAIVRRRFPDAFQRELRVSGETPEFQVIKCDQFDDDGDRDDLILGYGHDEASAWSHAAERLRLRPPEWTPPNAITVWRFEDAPEAFRNLSDHGGDEDWLAYLPSAFEDRYILWLEAPHFGCYSASRHPVWGGEVVIGTHG